MYAYINSAKKNPRRTAFVNAFAVLALAGVIISGCRSIKEVTYFQPNTPEEDSIARALAERYVPTIKTGDILVISIKGLDPKNDGLLNPLPEQSGYVVQQNTGTVAPPSIIGFTVDGNGNILLPMFGEVHVAGMKSADVEKLLTEKAKEYLKSPTVSVRIGNYYVSVLGEVVRPSRYTVPNERLTLPEAIAMAGDLTIYGERKNVMVMREENNKMTFARLNLTRRDVFNSPYYYLRAGDIVYVEAIKGKLTSTDRLYQLAPLTISSISLMILILTTIL